MSDDNNIPVLTDLIESGIEIKMSDLGFADDPQIGTEDLQIKDDDPGAGDIDLETPASELLASDLFDENPALEQAVRRILDEHMELAWQEIRLLIKRELHDS